MVTLPVGLTRLATLVIQPAPQFELLLPADMTNLSGLILTGSVLHRFSFPSAPDSLQFLSLNRRGLTNVNLSGCRGLLSLSLERNALSDLSGIQNLTRLTVLELERNEISDLTPLWGMSRLEQLDLDHNDIRSLQGLEGLVSLKSLDLDGNRIVDTRPLGQLRELRSLELAGNQLTEVVLPQGIPALDRLFLDGNRISQLTLPPSLRRLSQFTVNTLSRLIISEHLAEGDLRYLLPTIRTLGTEVYTYPLIPRLEAIYTAASHSFAFRLFAPPGAYRISGSQDLLNWTELQAVSNPLGSTQLPLTAPLSEPQVFFTATAAE